MKRKRLPSDYGQFYFRVPLAEQPKIEAEIESVLEILRKRQGPADLLPKRNELILRALRRGLKAIERDLQN